MGERVTIMLDDDIIKKLREKQAKLIKESTKSLIFSRVINEAIRKDIK